LSDFWELVEDREKIESVWTGTAQSAAALLLTSWQVDYDKSLLDIQRVFQRRWLDYDLLLPIDRDSVSVSFFRGPIYGVDAQAGLNVSGLTLELVVDGSPVTVVSLSGSNPVSVASICDQINDALGLGDTQYKIASYTTAPSGAKHIKLEHDYLLQVRPSGSANAVLGFSTTSYTQNDLSYSSGAAVSASKLDAFEAADPVRDTLFDFKLFGVALGSLLEVGGEGYVVSHAALETHPTPTYYRGLALQSNLPDALSRSWSVPSVIDVSGVDLVYECVNAGDLIVFGVDSAGGSSTQVYCSVTAVSGSMAGFDPLPLLTKLGGNPDAHEVFVDGILRINYVPVDSLVDSIPRLQEVVHGPRTVLSENANFSVETISVSGEDRRVIDLYAGTYSLMDPPPDTLWAEVTYLDNRGAVEDNFGSLVGFTLDDMRRVSSNMDYLSAVRGLWWAYFGGPSLHRVHVGTQILLGLPFAEADGTVTRIDQSFSSSEGRITIRDHKDVDVIRTYFYPLAAGLPIVDGSELAEGDDVSRFDPLSSGVEVKDYISDPDWMNSYVNLGAFREVDRYFRFLVRGDVDAFSLANLTFAMDFVKKIKPHYTYPLFVMLKNLGDTEVDVLDNVSMLVRMHLVDSICAYNTGGYIWDEVDGSGTLLRAYDETPPRFLHDKMSLCPSDDVWFLLGYTHPGSAGWYYDTIWAYDDGDTTGDGSSNDIVPLSGPDSQAPPPYGPLVGVIDHDATVTAGRYWRSRR
jgi:hypothetical protein